jgi:hypothetical protein
MWNFAFKQNFATLAKHWFQFSKVKKKLPNFYIWFSMRSHKYKRLIQDLYFIFGL